MGTVGRRRVALIPAKASDRTRAHGYAHARWSRWPQIHLPGDRDRARPANIWP